MNGRDWFSERILFGLLFIVGYLAIIVISMFLSMTPDQRSMAHDGLLVLGPIVGAIAAAIWRTDKTDKQAAESITGLTAAVNTAMTLPPAPTVQQ